ncbi:MAG: alpha/beta hydrolase [Ktedonobacteraceae bacterium]
MESSDSHKKSTDSLSTHTVTRYTVTRHAYGPDKLNFGDLYLPATPGPHPLVPLLHGGFWRAAYDLTLMDGLATWLASRGIGAWNVEYRRVGNRGGGWPGTMHDVAQALDYLRAIETTANIDLRRVVPVGHSAGGHLALWLAARSRLPLTSPLASAKSPFIPLGAISLAGAVDLELVWQLKLSRNAAGAFLGGSPTAFPARYSDASPASLLPLGVPQVLIHGDNDANVPLSVSQNYARKALAAGDKVKLIELPGADHFVVIDPSSEAWTITMREIQILFARP